MQRNFKTIAVIAALAIGSTGFAYAQGGSTDKNGNAIGSQNVSSTGGPQKMHSSSHHRSKHHSRMKKSQSE